jgi:lysophospholipase L1-like esterase
MRGAASGVTPVGFARFVALGDSTTEGLEDRYPDGGYRGWADRLAELLAPTSPGLAYANLAIRGRKVPQIRAEQLQPAIRLEPDLASILGGINDLLRRSFEVDRVVADLDAMAVALGERGATVLVFTFPDPTAVITVARKPIRARVEAFNDGVRRMAAARGAVLVDLAADGVADPTNWCADRLHANGAGHARIAAAAATALGVAGGPAPAATAPPRRRAAPARYAADAAWIGRHLTPWLLRRLRGISSGDGREPKRPELLPVSAD